MVAIAIALTRLAPRTMGRRMVGFGGALVLRHRVVLEDLALEDPHFDAAGPIGRVGGGDAIVNVGAQGVQRHPAFAVPLEAGDFRSPSRPEQLMRIPSAPRRIADCTERFMARRNATRRSSCWAMVSATSVASISGFLTSTMLR